MKRFLLLIIALYQLQASFATHLAGGTIEVACNGGNSFIITVTKYKDPAGNPMQPPFAVTVEAMSNGNTNTYPLQLQTFNQQLQPPVTNPCLIPPPNSFLEEYIYTATVTMANGTGYYIYEMDNARNTTQNVVGAGQGPAQTLYAEFPDPGIYGCNNSPEWTIGPPIAVCLNEPLNYDGSAVDADGDALTYRLCEALSFTAANNTPPFPVVNYANPYSGNYPVSSNPALSINPNTGLVTGTPNLNGRWLFNICVDEYRNGVKIGEYMREVQMTVSNCSQPTPVNIDPDYTSQALGGIPVKASCEDFTVAFTNTNPNAFSYSWDFGVPGINNDTSSQENPVYTYPDTGTFTARIITNAGFICADTGEITVIVYPDVFPGFTTTEPVCAGQPVTFTDTSTMTYGTVFNWAWTFGAVGVPNSGTPIVTRTYNNPGNYNTRLIIETSKGCRDTSIQTIPVAMPPSANLPSGPIIVCAGKDTLLTPTSNGVTFEWTPAAAVSCDTCKNTRVTVSSPTVLTFTAYGATGCFNSDNIVIQTVPSPVISAGPDQFLCGTGSVNLNAQVVSGPAGVLWNWSPATGLNSTQIPTPTASPSQTTTYIVTATAVAGGCIGVDTVTVYLNSVSVDAGTNAIICPNDTTTLNATTPVANATYVWTPNTAISNPNIASPSVWPTTNTWYTLTITDPVSGCTGIDSVLVTVNTPPAVNAGADTTICEGTIAQLSASGAQSYQWTTDPSLSQLNIANPTAAPSATTTYTVTGVDAIGCSAQDEVMVTIVPPAAISTSGDETICIGSVTTLNASGGIVYSWTPTNTLVGAASANPIANPSTTTTYSLTVEDANGCFIDTTLTVTVVPLPTVDAGADVAICFGDTTQLQASGGVSYSWTPNVALSNPNSANPLANPQATTTYTVVGTDANGCENIDSVTVTVNTLANGAFSPDTAICIGESVTLTASGFSQYQWKPGATLSCTNCQNTVATPVATTDYTVVVTDQNGCVDSGAVKVTVNPLPTVVTGPDQTICVGDSAILSASFGNPREYSWTPGNTLSDPTIRNPWASPLTTTTYTIEGTDQNGCVNTNTVTVNVNPLPIITTTYSSITICEGDTAQLNASGGVSYQWSPGSTLSCTNCPDPVASPLLNTMYTVLVTDANGCSNMDSVAVNVNVLQPGNFIADTAICIGESVTLFANGFTQYNWFPATNLSCTGCPSPIATPTSTITYFAAVEDANGCQDTGSVEITVNPLPVPAISVADDTVCIGTSTVLTATGGVAYTWSPAQGLSDPLVAMPTATPLTSTIYTVQVTDANGCQNTTSQSITVMPLPVVTVTTASPYVCKYDSTRLTASGGVSYQWNPAGTLSCNNCPDPFAFPLSTTTYSVSVTDQFGCINEDSITVLVNEAAGNISPDTAICTGGAATLTIGGGVNYLWYPGTDLSCTNCPNPIATPTTTITYNVEVTDVNGCRDTADVTVAVNPLPTVTAGPDVTICESEQTQLAATSPTATIFNWSPATGLSNASIANPVATPATTITYTLTVEDANSCQNTDDVTVTVNQRPLTNAGSDVAICLGDTTLLQANGAVSYVWSPGIGLSCNNCPDPEAFPSVTTTYTVTGTAANGCTRDDEITVTVNTLPTVAVTPSSTICIGDDIQLVASGGQNYQWSPAGSLSCTNCANPIATPTTTTTYSVIAFNAAGCSDETTTTITVASPAAITVSADTTVCPSAEVQLTAAGGVTYNWTPQNNSMVGANTASPSITVTQNQAYTVLVTDINGCEITETVDIGVFIPAEPSPTTTADTICFGDSVQLSASNGVTYMWSPADPIDVATAADPIARPAVTTVFTVDIIDANGCPNTDQVAVTVIQLPLVDAGPDISLYAASRAVLEATGAVSYSWSPNIWIQDTSVNRTFIYPEDSITYIVVGTDAFGCQNTDTVNVFVLPSPRFYVPNAFTPDGDGQNDVFRIQQYENFVLESLQVFNRWGQLVFATSDITEPWDGRLPNGDPLPAGTYIFVIKGTDEIGVPLGRQGNITILR